MKIRYRVPMQQCLICDAQGVPCRVSGMDLLRCPGCGFLWLKEKILSENYYGDLDIGATERKVERRKRNVQDRLKKIKRFISLNHTCDVGTGDGLFLQMLHSKGYSGCWGIEPSDTGVRHSRALGLDVEQGTIDDIPSIKQNRHTNVFTLYHVLEHLDDPRASLKLLRDQLPHGGHVVIEVPNLHGFFAEKLGEDWEFYYPEHLWYFDDETLPRFVEQCGYRVIKKGRRDFDTSRKSLHELLFRLGLKKRSPSKPSSSSKSSLPSAKPSRGMNPVAKFCLTIVKKILATLVEMLGRTDSVWVVAQKV